LIHVYLGVLQFVVVVMFCKLIGIPRDCYFLSSGIVGNVSSNNNCEQNSERVHYLCPPYNWSGLNDTSL